MIPDQALDVETARANAVTTYLESVFQQWCNVQVDVMFKAAPDYPTAVDYLVARQVGFGWLGGLTGVNAGLQDEGSVQVAQRIEDQQFTSVFVSIDETLSGIDGAENKSVAFGSEVSTSGHLMPEYFLRQANVVPSSTTFTGSHDNTLDSVINGTFEVGALNSVVYNRRKEANTTDGAVVFYTTPPYADYLWVGGSFLQQEWEDAIGSNGTNDRCKNIYKLLEDAFLQASMSNNSASGGQEVLTTFSATGFVSVPPGLYGPIESIGCELGLIASQYCQSSGNGTTTSSTTSGTSGSLPGLSSLAQALIPSMSAVAGFALLQ